MPTAARRRCWGQAMASKRAFDPASLAHEWDRKASEREARVRREDPEDTPAIRRMLHTQSVTLRACAADLRREAARGG